MPIITGVALGFICRGALPVNSLPISFPIVSSINPWSTGFASLTVGPMRPKRPASAWVHFLSDFRKKNAELPAKDVMVSASKEWKLMTDLHKKPFQDLYVAAKKVYDVDQDAYVKSGQKEADQDASVKSGQKGARRRDPEKPKKPPAAFFHFLSGYRTENESLKLTESAKLAGAIWKDMSAKQKKPYEKQYKDEKSKYDEAMKLYKGSGKEEAWKAQTGKTSPKTGKTTVRKRKTTVK